MNLRSLAVIASAVLGGCGDESAAPLGDVIRQDDGSDEVLQIIADEVARDGVTVDPLQAATLITPADGEVVPGANTYTFTWQLPPSSRPVPRHGTITGTFVWLHLEGPGLDPPIEVVSLESTSWTPDGVYWPRLQAATGPITATLITTVVDREVIEQGPFRAAADDDVTFTISQ